MPEVNNPFDLTKTAIQYKWDDAHDMRIVIDVKQARGDMDCYNQLYCWMRDHFKKITKMEIDLAFGDCSQFEIDDVHEKFHKEFYNCVRYENA